MTKKQQPIVCTHKRTIFSTGSLGDSLICEDCGGKRLEDKPDLGKWLRKGLGKEEPS